MFENAMMALMDYVEDVDDLSSRCAVVREFGVGAYIVAIACEEIEEGMAQLQAGHVCGRRPQLRLWPTAAKWFDSKVDRGLMDALFFKATDLDGGTVGGPKGKQ